MSHILKIRTTGVAGVYAPAFVERVKGLQWYTGASRSVAGVYAPAFVERSSSSAVLD